MSLVVFHDWVLVRNDQLVLRISVDMLCPCSCLFLFLAHILLDIRIGLGIRSLFNSCTSSL